MIPHCCPVCLGHGRVCGGFYSCVPGGTPMSTNTSELCRSCNGLGIIYCPEEEQDPNILKSGVYPPQIYPYGNDELVQVLKRVTVEIENLSRILSEKKM